MERILQIVTALAAIGTSADAQTRVTPAPSSSTGEVQCTQHIAKSVNHIYPARASGFYRLDYVRLATLTSCTERSADIEAVRFFPAGCERDHYARTAILRFCHNGILQQYTWASRNSTTPTCERIELETFATRQSTSKTMPHLCSRCCSTDATDVPQQFQEYVCELPSSIGSATDYSFQATFFEADSTCNEQNKSMLLAYHDTTCMNNFDPVRGGQISIRGNCRSRIMYASADCPTSESGVDLLASYGTTRPMCATGVSPGMGACSADGSAASCTTASPLRDFFSGQIDPMPTVHALSGWRDWCDFDVTQQVTGAVNPCALHYCSYSDVPPFAFDPICCAAVRQWCNGSSTDPTCRLNSVGRFIEHTCNASVYPNSLFPESCIPHLADCIEDDSCRDQCLHTENRSVTRCLTQTAFGATMGCVFGDATTRPDCRELYQTCLGDATCVNCYDQLAFGLADITKGAGELNASTLRMCLGSSTEFRHSFYQCIGLEYSPDCRNNGRECFSSPACDACVVAILQAPDGTDTGSLSACTDHSIASQAQGYLQSCEVDPEAGESCPFNRAAGAAANMTAPCDFHSCQGTPEGGLTEDCCRYIVQYCDTVDDAVCGSDFVTTTLGEQCARYSMGDPFAVCRTHVDQCENDDFCRRECLLSLVPAERCLGTTSSFRSLTDCMWTNTSLGHGNCGEHYGMCMTDGTGFCGKCLVSIGMHTQISQSAVNRTMLYECLLQSDVFRTMFYTCLDQHSHNDTTCTDVASDCFDGFDPYACESCYTAVMSSDRDEFLGGTAHVYADILSECQDDVSLMSSTQYLTRECTDFMLSSPSDGNNSCPFNGTHGAYAAGVLTPCNTFVCREQGQDESLSPACCRYGIEYCNDTRFTDPACADERIVTMLGNCVRATCNALFHACTMEYNCSKHCLDSDARELHPECYTPGSEYRSILDCFFTTTPETPACPAQYSACMDDETCRSCFSDVVLQGDDDARGSGSGSGIDSNSSLHHRQCMVDSQLYRSTVYACFQMDEDGGDCAASAMRCIADDACDQCIVVALQADVAGTPADPDSYRMCVGDSGSAERFAAFTTQCFGSDDGSGSSSRGECPFNTSIAVEQNWVSPCRNALCESAGVRIECCGVLQSYCAVTEDPGCWSQVVREINDTTCGRVSVLSCREDDRNVMSDPGAELDDGSWSAFARVYDVSLQTHVFQIGPASRTAYVAQSLRVPRNASYFFFEGYIRDSDVTDTDNVGSIYLIFSTTAGEVYVDDFSTAVPDRMLRPSWVLWHHMAYVPAGAYSVIIKIRRGSRLSSDSYGGINVVDFDNFTLAFDCVAETSALTTVAPSSTPTEGGSSCSNVVRDPMFRKDATPWTLGSGEIISSPNTSHSIATASSGTVSVYQEGIWIPLGARMARVSAIVRVVNPSGVAMSETGFPFVSLRVTTANGTYVGYCHSNVETSTQWTRLDVQCPLDSRASYARVELRRVNRPSPTAAQHTAVTLTFDCPCNRRHNVIVNGDASSAQDAATGDDAVIGWRGWPREFRTVWDDVTASNVFVLGDSISTGSFLAQKVVVPPAARTAILQYALANTVAEVVVTGRGFVRGSFPGRSSSVIYEDSATVATARVAGHDSAAPAVWQRHRVQMTVPAGASVLVVRLGRMVSLADPDVGNIAMFDNISVYFLCDSTLLAPETTAGLLSTTSIPDTPTLESFSDIRVVEDENNVAKHLRFETLPRLRVSFTPLTPTPAQRQTLPRRLMVAVLQILVAPPWSIQLHDVLYVVSQPLQGRVVVVLRTRDTSAPPPVADVPPISFTVDGTAVSSASVVECACNASQLEAMSGERQSVQESDDALSAGVKIAIVAAVVVIGGGIVLAVWRRYQRQDRERVVLAGGEYSADRDGPVFILANISDALNSSSTTTIRPNRPHSDVIVDPGELKWRAEARL
eukprot:m.223982 g.223982  ORF g.223982 m.223982 type:complete len:1925 (-) comp19197_c0_seq33:1986-7760(-)